MHVPNGGMPKRCASHGEILASRRWNARSDHSRLGHINVAEYLLQSGADVNAQCTGGITPLIAAVLAGSAATVELLLRNGAEVDRVAEDKYTCVEWRNG